MKISAYHGSFEAFEDNHQFKVLIVWSGYALVCDLRWMIWVWSGIKTRFHFSWSYDTILFWIFKSPLEFRQYKFLNLLKSAKTQTIKSQKFINRPKFCQKFKNCQNIQNQSE